MIIAKTRPRTQARRVPTGMSGSSVLATAERTSGYGESSSAKGQKNGLQRERNFKPNKPARAASLSMLGSSKSARMSAAGNNEREKDEIIDHSILPGSPLRFSMSEILSSFSGWRENMVENRSKRARNTFSDLRLLVSTR
jgi:hypothetical protein